MRFETIAQLRDAARRVPDTVDAALADRPTVKAVRRETVRRRAIDEAAPYALRALQPVLRQRVGRGLSSRFDLLCWGDRFALGSMNALVRRLLPIGPSTRALIEGCDCGDGLMQHWLRAGVRNIEGIDIVNFADAWARSSRVFGEAFGATVGFRQGTVATVPYENSSFDVVASTNVYEHVAHLPEAARESARVLKPGGLAVHCIGPLYYSPGGDHCISEFGLHAAFDHLLLDEPDYRGRIADDAFFATRPDPSSRGWARRNAFSYATADEYMTAFGVDFDCVKSIACISPMAVEFRKEFPEKWRRLLDAGMKEDDLLVSMLYVVFRKR